MQATTTTVINRFWKKFYSNYFPEDPKEGNDCQVKDDKESEDEQEEIDEDNADKVEEETSIEKIHSSLEPANESFNDKEIKWRVKPKGVTCLGENIYSCASVCGYKVVVSSVVVLEASDMPYIYYVEYMYEKSDARKMVHGRGMLRGYQTVLGNAANDKELFCTNKCVEFELGEVKHTVDVDMSTDSLKFKFWNDVREKRESDRACERKKKGLPLEYFCKILYWPERGAFFHLPCSTMGSGDGNCYSCQTKEIDMDDENFEVDSSKPSFTYKGNDFYVHDFIYVSPRHFAVDGEDNETFKGGRNAGLKAYVICHLLEIDVSKEPKQTDPVSTLVKVRRFFRPEDISAEKAYISDIREVYYSEQICDVPVVTIEGKCEVRMMQDYPTSVQPAILEHIFFCRQSFDPATGVVNQLPAHIKLGSSSLQRQEISFTLESDFVTKQHGFSHQDDRRLVALDLFAGCGGLTQGLQQSGASFTRCSIDSNLQAANSFNKNHPKAEMYSFDSNVTLRAALKQILEEDKCISTSEVAELAEQLSYVDFQCLRGVDFITGGPLCQGFSGTKRFHQSIWSKVQCDNLLTFLSFAQNYSPRFILLETTRDFVCYTKGPMFRLTLASLLEMGYQVRFGVLEAGAYRVPQIKKRAFIWAASIDETLPEWPEPMHVSASPEQYITLPGNVQYAAVRSTASGAPYRAITVRDTIGDLLAVSTKLIIKRNKPVSWYQKNLMGKKILWDNVSAEMTEQNCIRCQRIPKHPGDDWHDLLNEKVKLSTGEVVDLIPRYLANIAKRDNQWNGLFGRLDWEGNFPNFITNPQLIAKVGMCFHPEQHRMITVREFARSQGFPDSYQFDGNIEDIYWQIADACPPPLAFALGRELKELVNGFQ